MDSSSSLNYTTHFFIFCVLFDLSVPFRPPSGFTKGQVFPITFTIFTPCWYCGFPALFLPIPSQIKNCKLNKPITVEHYFNFITLIICFFGSRSKKQKKNNSIIRFVLRKGGQRRFLYCIFYFCLPPVLHNMGPLKSIL